VAAWRHHQQTTATLGQQRFSDPAAESVYAAIKSLDLASQHQMLRALHVKLHAEDDAMAHRRRPAGKADPRR
jgi:hypothetical protein